LRVNVLNLALTCYNAHFVVYLYIFQVGVNQQLYERAC